MLQFIMQIYENRKQGISDYHVIYSSPDFIIWNNFYILMQPRLFNCIISLEMAHIINYRIDIIIFI